MAESEINTMSSGSGAAASSDDAAGIPDAAVVSLADAVSHALENQPSAGSAIKTEDQQESEPPPLVLGPPPQPLPTGWVLRESLSQPNYYYYYNMETGIATWHSPVIPQQQPKEDDGPDLGGLADAAKLALKDVAAAAAAAVASSTKSSSERSSNRKRSHHHASTSDDNHNTASSIGNNSNKKSKTSSSSGGSSISSSGSGGGSGGGKPSKVRILHILKKHKDSRRPSSWRQPKITATKEEAREELQGLIEILEEESGEAQRATFEELARTESDCSSAKRGGDLGFFGPKKMQPQFEEASFALKIGQLSGIVETSSGVHVLLRIG